MLNKVTQNIIPDEEVLDFQPSDREIAQYESESNLSDEEFAHLQKELDYFYTTPPPSYYALTRDDNRGNWDKPHVTRTKEELFDHLYFYDAIKERENLSKIQLEDVQKEVDQIHKELKVINDYDFFLKHGYERLHANKNQFSELQDIKFYQREENLWVFDSIEDHVKINLPIEKWWISENEIIKHANVDLHTFVDFRLVNSLAPSLNKHKYAQIRLNDNDAPVIQQAIKLDKPMPDLPPPEDKRNFLSKLFKKHKTNTTDVISTKEENKNPTPGNFPTQKDTPSPSPNKFPHPGNEQVNPTPFPNPSNNPAPTPNFPTNNNPSPPTPPPGIANNNKTSAAFGAPPIPPRNFATGTTTSAFSAPPIPAKKFPNSSTSSPPPNNQTKNNYFDYQAK